MIDQSKMEKWLKDKVSQLSCPCCGHKQLFPGQFPYQPQYGTGYGNTSIYTPSPPPPAFTLQSELLIALQLEKDKFINYMGGLALATLICNSCGYVMFFDAKKLGLL